MQVGLTSAVKHSLSLLSRCPALVDLESDSREALAVVVGIGGLRSGPAFEDRVVELLNGLLLLGQ